MKKMRLIIVVGAVLGLVSSSPAYADGFAPGEGLYLGAFVAGGTGIVQPKVATEGSTRSSIGTPCSATCGGDAEGLYPGHAAGTFEATDGGLGLAGIEGGGMVGYGYKMGDLYAGLEGEMAAGDVKFRLTSATPITLSGSTASGNLVTLSTIEAEKKWTGGMFGRLGYYLNADTLFALRGGVLVSKFDVTTTGSTNYSETYYGGGPSVGGSMESRLSAIDPNLSMRIGAVYTDFLTASVFSIGDNQGNHTTSSGHDSEVTGSALSVRLGVQYSFFDVNSLF